MGLSENFNPNYCGRIFSKETSFFIKQLRYVFLHILKRWMVQKRTIMSLDWIILKKSYQKVSVKSGAKGEYLDTCLNRQQLGTKSLKRPKNSCQDHETFLLTKLGCQKDQWTNIWLAKIIPRAVGPNTMSLAIGPDTSGHCSPPDPKGRKIFLYM
jgi:hypothetical protein